MTENPMTTLIQINVVDILHEKDLIDDLIHLNPFLISLHTFSLSGIIIKFNLMTRIQNKIITDWKEWFSQVCVCLQGDTSSLSGW